MGGVGDSDIVPLCHSRGVDAVDVRCISSINRRREVNCWTVGRVGVCRIRGSKDLVLREGRGVGGVDVCAVRRLQSMMLRYPRRVGRVRMRAVCCIDLAGSTDCRGVRQVSVNRPLYVNIVSLSKARICGGMCVRSILCRHMVKL